MKRPYTLLLFLYLPMLSLAQGSMALSAANSRMVIKGTSTLHDWQCKVEQMNGQLVATLEGNTVKSIQSLTFNAVAASIRSIKESGEYYEKGMDKNVYKALKSDQYANISFALKKVNSITTSGGKTSISSTGTLTIAGTPKDITITVTAIPSAGGLTFEGTFPMKMTDFKVDPPTALLGTIKTGDAITIEFKAAYSPR